MSSQFSIAREVIAFREGLGFAEVRQVPRTSSFGILMTTGASPAAGPFAAGGCMPWLADRLPRSRHELDLYRIRLVQFDDRAEVTPFQPMAWEVTIEDNDV